MSSENGLVFNEIQNKFQCKSQISSYLNVILHFWPFLAEKTQKWGKSHIFGFISEKSQLTDLNHPVFVLVLVSYNFCMIPLLCPRNFGYSDPVDRGSHQVSSWSPNVSMPIVWIQSSFQKSTISTHKISPWRSKVPMHTLWNQSNFQKGTSDTHKINSWRPKFPMHTLCVHSH